MSKEQIRKIGALISGTQLAIVDLVTMLADQGIASKEYFRDKYKNHADNTKDQDVALVLRQIADGIDRIGGSLDDPDLPSPLLQ